MNCICLAFNKGYFVTTYKMLNGNEENKYRHRPEYMEFVGRNI